MCLILSYDIELSLYIYIYRDIDIDIDIVHSAQRGRTHTHTTQYYIWYYMYMYTGDSEDSTCTYWSLLGFLCGKKRANKSSHLVRHKTQMFEMRLWLGMQKIHRKPRNHRFVSNSMLHAPDSHDCSGTDSGWLLKHVTSIIVHQVHVFWWAKAGIANARQGQVGWHGAYASNIMKPYLSWGRSHHVMKIKDTAHV